MAELTGTAAPGLGARLRPTAGWHAGRRLSARLWRRSRAQPRPAALPLALLLLALSTLFLFGGDREYFYRGGFHDWSSSHTLSFAENLSFQRNLLIYHYQSRDADGNLQPRGLYNRFPPGGYALVKLAVLPFGDTDFRAQIYAGRMLLLLLFSGGAVLAYYSLARITGSRWDALTATLLAFSSYYVLYYADMISSEVTLDLFAVMLAFHGMVVFVQEGRFRQLLVKSCVALLLGWHVYAFLLPFIVFGIVAELLKARQSDSTPPRMLRNITRYAVTLGRSRHLLLGLVTLLCGSIILAFIIGNDYLALDGAASLRELPAVSSAAKRLSVSRFAAAEPAVAQLKPERFWPEQFYRIAVMTLPYAVNPYEIKKSRFPRYRFSDYPAIAVGVLALGVCLVGLVSIRRRPAMARLLGTLVAAGWCWAGLVRQNAVGHDFESVFYIGIPLVAFTLTLLGLRRLRYGVRLAPYFAVVALAVFVLSVAELAGVGQSGAELAVEGAQLDDYAAIRELVDDGPAVYVPHPHRESGFPGAVGAAGAPWALAYFLSGKTLVHTDQSGAAPPPQAGDYLLLAVRADSPALLTPDNRYVFLYDWTLYEQWQRTAYRDADPIIAGDWRVYLGDGHLTYQSPECVHRDARFLLHFVPQSTADLPLHRREYGFDNRDFIFRIGGVQLSDGTCVMERALPDYDIAAIRTGQYTDAGRIWAGEYVLPAP